MINPYQCPINGSAIPNTHLFPSDLEVDKWWSPSANSKHGGSEVPSSIFQITTCFSFVCASTSFAMLSTGSRSGPILLQRCNSLLQGTASSTRCRETNLKRCRCFCPVPTCPASTAKPLALTNGGWKAPSSGRFQWGKSWETNGIWGFSHDFLKKPKWRLVGSEFRGNSKPIGLSMDFPLLSCGNPELLGFPVCRIWIQQQLRTPPFPPIAGFICFCRILGYPNLHGSSSFSPSQLPIFSYFSA